MVALLGALALNTDESIPWSAIVKQLSEENDTGVSIP
jgi:hypothetical protein